MTVVRSLSKKSGGGALATPTDLEPAQVAKVAAALNQVLADAFVLYLKTKNFHWHVSGKHFRDYHLLLDEQAGTIFATFDDLAERVRKLGAPTIHSFAEVLKLTTLKENNDGFITPEAMFEELIADNKAIIKTIRNAHAICDEADDIASAGLLEGYIDEAEKRLWFLFETNQNRTDSAS
ncbi:Dps family protein [Xanthobacter sp. TB0136]|uniref:Dps family protein n=1 Tax=Xanthobacter sp. TB0136 TaxID=3459177 RepID=UPI004039268A